MIMDARRQLWSLARIVLPCFGFALTCVGAYLVSLQTGYKFSLRLFSSYFTVGFGILIMLIGAFWAICHSLKIKMYLRGEHEQQIRIYTIDRPSSFPPSYEESQGSQQSPATAPEVEVVVDGVDVAMRLAPPLYSLDTSDALDCTWSREQPPLYSQVELVQRGEVAALGAEGGLCRDTEGRKCFS